MSTVGYGDVYCTTVLGRTFLVFFLLVGLVSYFGVRGESPLWVLTVQVLNVAITTLVVSQPVRVNPSQLKYKFNLHSLSYKMACTISVNSCCIATFFVFFVIPRLILLRKEKLVIWSVKVVSIKNCPVRL